MRNRDLALLALALGLLAPGAAQGQSGIQVSPDDRRVLVSKDVGAERWALTRNLEDGSVTGNVFFADGGDPQFIACDEISREGSDVRLRCEASQRCPLAPCTVHEWTAVGEVTLPISFFERGEVAQGASAAVFAARPGINRIAQAGDAKAGVQLTPDRRSTLINKDVSGQRWAITLNGDDSTVTGNVFFPDGSDPAFIWCRRSGQDDADLILDCYGADRCGSGGCNAGDWALLFEVKIAQSFFQPPENVSTLEFEQALREAVGDGGAFDALLLALSEGYSLRQVARGGLAGRITAPGEILTSAGTVEAPEGEPIDLGTGTTADLGRVAFIPRSTLNAIRRQLEAAAPPGVNVDPLSALLLILERYKDPKQIFEAIDEGRIGFDQDVAELGAGAVVLVDDNGDPIPANPISRFDVFSIPELRNAVCGNGILDPGEACDPKLSTGKSCSSFQFDDGEISCHPDLCRWDTRKCSRCGNQIREEGEECDGSDVHGLTCRALDENHTTSAIPACDDRCRLDTGPCENAVPGGCPDGRLESGEDCDGAVFRPDRGRDCSMLDPTLYGTLGCSSSTCTYDTGPCLPRGSGCGNGVLDEGEDCDGSQFRIATCAEYDQRYRAGLLRCRVLSCTYNTIGCLLEAPSPTPTPSATATPSPTGSPRPTGQPTATPNVTPSPAPTPQPTPQPTEEPPMATPTPGPVCGNGLIEPPEEECEGNNLGGQSCGAIGFGFGPGGTLACDRCRFDSSGCIEDTAPTVTSVGPNPLVVPVGGSGILTVFFSDPNGDVVTGCVTDAPNFSGACGTYDTGGATSGSVSGPLNCGSVPATFHFFAYVADSRGNESNYFPATLICEAQ